MITKIKTIAYALVFAQVFMFFPSAAFAQEQVGTPQEGTAMAEFAKNLVEGRSMCMDNYNFSSVKVTVDTEKSVFDRQYLPGETMTIAGTVNNPNNYPLVGGKLYAHILREDSSMESENWHPYVAQEFVPGTYDMAGGATSTFEYSYRIPEGSPQGTYRVEFYYMVGNRYVMSGVPYVTNFTGASAPFTVVRPTNAAATPVSGFTFNRNSIQVNGEAFQLRQVPPVLEPGKSITVTVPVGALGASAVSGTVQMDLYNWSVTDTTKPVVSQTIPVTVTASKATPITFTWDNAVPGTYELVLSASTTDVESVPSVLNVRFPVAGLVPRIVYSGVGAITEDSVIINACVVNATFGSGTGVLTNTLIVGGKEVETKEAVISAEQLSTALITVPIKSLVGKAFDVHVVAKDDQGVVTDESTVSYPAGSIGGGDLLLSPITPGQAQDASGVSSPSYMYLYIGVITALVILLIVLVGFVVARKKKYPTIS